MKISIWRFDDAPKKYQDMSRHGGDEDWVIVFHNIVSLFTDDWTEIASPFYQLLPDYINWDISEQQQERDYAVSWGFIRRVRDGNDLVTITAHS